MRKSTALNSALIIKNRFKEKLMGAIKLGIYAAKERAKNLSINLIEGFMVDIIHQGKMTSRLRKNIDHRTQSERFMYAWPRQGEGAEASGRVFRGYPSVIPATLRVEEEAVTTPTRRPSRSSSMNNVGAGAHVTQSIPIQGTLQSLYSARGR